MNGQTSTPRNCGSLPALPSALPPAPLISGRRPRPRLRLDLAPGPLPASRLLALAVLLAGVGLTAVSSRGDETCMSPYMPKIQGQEEFVYVWTLGMDGIGDASDKLVTVDVRPGSGTFGKVVHSVSIAGQHEAHHGGFTDDRREFWVGGLDTSRIFVFDVHSDPERPRLTKTIDDFVESSGGVVGPHGFFALPGRLLISGLSNDKDRSGRTGIVEYTNDGRHIATYWMPTDAKLSSAGGEQVADGYGYDLRVLPRKNIMLTSSFTGWSNYMMDFGKMLEDQEAMKRFGQTVVLWDLHARKPRKVLHVPGAPLEIRVAWGKEHNYAFTAAALTSKLWLIYEDDGGEWEAEAVADIGDPAKIPLPVDISLSSDDRTLFVNTFLDGMCRVFDVSSPHHPRQIYEKSIGSQVNMISQSWDGKRIYCTSSLLAGWDKKGEANEQFLKAYDWKENQLRHRFTIDFKEAGLGRPHIMRFGASSLYR